MRKIDKLIIHCTATPEGREVSVETIRKWHLGRGWRDIGYHFVIGLDGEVHEGRPIEQTGAHTKGQNYDSIGIAYVGGVEAKKVNGEWKAKDTRTDKQKEALEDLLCYLKIKYAAAKVYGHRDFSTKACPSFDAKTEYEWITNQF
jgi:N-acetylmuramoyl-L-alanine amidase|tara:strand:- start:5021 stop:5455 length:435 start_codon:yes stop_codon:yes gene_type:complete